MEIKPFSNPFDQDDKNKGASVQLAAWIILGMIAAGCCALSVSGMLLSQFNLDTVFGQYFQPQTPGPNLTAEASQATAVSAAGQWQISISDTFEDNRDHRWYVGTDDNQYLKIAYEVKDGKYRWDATAHQGFIQSIDISDKAFTNFYVTVEAQATGIAGISDYGILFREDGINNYYYFGVSNGGEFIVLLFNQGKWSNLLGPTASPLIRTEGANRLAVMGDESHFTFFINDRYVGEMTDNHIAEGRIGLATQLYEVNDQSIFEFDNVEIRTPPLPATPTPTKMPTPTITLLPTITPTPSVLLSPPEGAEVFEDSLDSNDQGWHDFYKNVPAEISDGKLMIASNASGSVEMAVCQKCPPYIGDFYYQAELLPSKSVPQAYGLSFCSPEYGSDYYIFEINLGTNSYYLGKLHLSTNTWEHLIFNEYSSAINNLPLSNILGVFVHQQEIDLYINGTLVDSVTASEALKCKRLGLFMDGGAFNLIADNVFAYEITGTPFLTPTPTP